MRQFYEYSAVGFSGLSYFTAFEAGTLETRKVNHSSLYFISYYTFSLLNLVVHCRCNSYFNYCLAVFEGKHHMLLLATFGSHDI